MFAKVKAARRLWGALMCHLPFIAGQQMLAEFACAYGARPSVMDADADTPPPPQGPGPTPRQYHMNQGLLERSGGVQVRDGA